ncbi:MAG: UDP-N-acetylmuramoyl-L-alanine--D-glutamate ligase [Acidimicrobiia bacterium]|nr:UDP-N-acetylmuramoyl-L-alanine--D-glutamate ligase [Acidimicrobiia bacterium]
MRTLVIGAGITGRAAANLARDLGDAVIVFDRDPAAVADLAGTYPTASGDWSSDLLARIDRLVVSPGVPERAPEIRDALAIGIPVVSEIELAASLVEAPLVAVTGTNGKTTVTALIADMLIAAGRKAVATGNIGTALAEVVGESWDVVVVEVSSFQLRFIEQFRPRVAVLLNIAEDHLDWHGTLHAYAAAKANIFRNQDASDALVYDIDDPGARAAVADAPSRLLPVSGTRIPHGGAGPAGGELVLSAGSVPLGGLADASFIVDVAAAAVAAGELGVGLGAIAAVVSEFRPGPHRRTRVGEWRGVSWIDDSKATNPHAARAAAVAYDSVVLIAGGRNKGLDLAPLLTAETVKHVVAIGETRDEIVAAVGDPEHVTPAGSLIEAIDVAAAVAEKGDTVLLAPGCASFDMFSSYAARGDAFAEAVRGFHQDLAGPV